MHIGLSAQIVS